MAPREARWQTALFYGAWLFIILVSVFDGYLALRHRHVIRAIELNPVGRALIDSNGGAVWHLLTAKFVGTVIACAIVLLIRRASARLGLIVVFALALFQFSLLLYLLFA
jgi:hypothetical protein